MNDVSKMRTITACPVRGREKTFVNVYGLGEDNRVYQWNAKLGGWEPHKIAEKARGSQW